LRQHAVDGRPVHAKGRIEVEPGSRMTIIEAGGGGMGTPAKRDAAALAADIEDGFVTAAAAKRLYGKKKR
jgi:N-methylhydantoinase B